MEVECDLSKINNEELLRKMWQQSEDANRKKEIRSQLYKLRESRLRDLYQGDIMADSSVAGFGKDPMATSHGDALADQSFQSLKSKEIRDSLSPTEMKFQSMALNNPNTTGWDVQSSKEVTPDGRGFRAETVATTDGVESVNGGIAEFKGRNEQRSSAHHQGDDKNFVKKAMESSNSHLHEKVVIGDENSGRTEVRTSSSTSTSSSQVIKSSTNVEYNDGFPIQQPNYQRNLMDAERLKQENLQRQRVEQERLLEEQRIYEEQFQQQREKHLNQQERYSKQEVSTTRQNTQQKNISQNIETQETHEQNKRYVDLDKASPEYQQHVQYLMQQPGDIISNTVEYPKPNVKMITTVKRLPDGTIVRNKRYETEELTPTPARPSSSGQPRHDSTTQQHQHSGTYQSESAVHTKSSQDMVDSSGTSAYIRDSHTDDVETKFSSIKKTNTKFSNEISSETVQEYSDHHSQSETPSRQKPRSNDFSTHGFPSVRPHKLTQEYPTDRPYAAHPKHGTPTQSVPSKPTEYVVPHPNNNADNIIERRVNTKDGEVIIVSSEEKRNFKTTTNSERIVETEKVVRDDQLHERIKEKDFTTHGFPSVREPSNHQSKVFENQAQIQPDEKDYSLNKLPTGARLIKNHIPQSPDEVVVMTSQKSHTAKHTTNTEHVVEHEILKDDQHSVQRKDNVAPHNYVVTTPGEKMPSAKTPGYEPYGDHPAGVLKHPINDFSTQGYPSVKTPTRPAAGLPSSYNQHPSSPRKSPSQDYTTHGFPSVRSPSKVTSPQSSLSNVEGRRTETDEEPKVAPTKTTPSRTPSPNKSKTLNTTMRETTERVIRKEKEVDSAHRAFAASLRSSSPIDHVRRESYTTDSHARHTPRSSLSSTRTFRRDMREGSHDSAPSETSRVSTTTVTRHTPPRAVGSRTVVTTKTSQGSNDRHIVSSPRSTKSPSPGKMVTITTTSTRTLTSKDVPKATDNQHTRITTNKIDTIFPINETPLTSITKTKLSENHKQPHKIPKINNSNSKKNMPVKTSTKASASAELEGVVEAPCIKKHYYKLGPSVQTPSQLQSTTSQPLNKSSQIYEKSPRKKQPSQPAPSSRCSTPSYSNRKLPASEMADDNDDDKPNTSAFSPPSSRSRTPQKTAPNDNYAPQNDWHVPTQPDNDDERRTVNRKATFEGTAHDLPQLTKPTFVQPNVEWVVAYNDDDYDDDDSDGFAPEVVDAKLTTKNITTKLITTEKQSPSLELKRKPKPTASSIKTTVTTTRQFHNTPLKSQPKPIERSPLKTKSHENRAPTVNRNPKLVTDAKSPGRTPLKSQPKVVDIKPLKKAPASIAPSRSPLRKPLPKTTTELRKNLNASQILKEKSTKIVEADKPKPKLQGPERKIKPSISDTNEIDDHEIMATEIHHTALVDKRNTQAFWETSNESKILNGQPNKITPYESDDEPLQRRNDKIPQDTINELYENSQQQNNYEKPKQASIDLTQPQIDEYGEISCYSNAQKESRKYMPVDQTKNKSPAFRKAPSASFQKLQSTFNERSPQYRKQYVQDVEPQQSLANIRSPKDSDNAPQPESYSSKPNEYIGEKPFVGKQPKQGYKDVVEEKLIEVIEENSQNASEPCLGSPDSERPTESKSNQKTFEREIIVTEKTKKAAPGQDIPKKGRQSPDSKPGPISPTLESQYVPNEVVAPYGDDCLTESESIVRTSHKAVAKHIQKFETNFLKNTSLKAQNAQIQNKFQPTAVNETGGSKSPKRIISPSRNQKKAEEPAGKRPQSPNKHVLQNRPEGTKVEATDKRPKSPSKHVSPMRTPKKPNEETCIDDDFESSSRTTNVVNKKMIRNFYGEQKNDRQLNTKDETLTENTEFISSSKRNIAVIEKEMAEFEQPQKNKNLPIRVESPTINKKSLDRKLGEEYIAEKSSGRPQKTPNQTLPTDDEAFRKTLRPNERINEIYSDDKTLLMKGEKPETMPEGCMSALKHTSDSEDETTLASEINEFTINLTQNRDFNEKLIQEFDETHYIKSLKPERGTKSPTKDVKSSTTFNRKLLEGEYTESTIQRQESVNQEPNEHFVTSQILKITEKQIEEPGYSVHVTKEPEPGALEEPTTKYSTNRRAQSPTKNQKKSSTKDETFDTILKTVDSDGKTGETEPHFETPKPYSGKVFHTDKNEPLTEANKYSTSSKIHLVTENNSNELKNKEESDKKPQRTENRSMSLQKGTVDEQIAETFSEKSDTPEPTVAENIAFKSTQKPEYNGSWKPCEKVQYEKPERTVYTSAFLRNTSENFITTEQQTLETEIKESPTRMSSSKKVADNIAQAPTHGKQSPIRSQNEEVSSDIPKSKTSEDKSLIKKCEKRKDGRTDTNEGESENLLIEMCAKDYVTERDNNSEENRNTHKNSNTLFKCKDQKSRETKPDDKNPDKSFTSTYVEEIKTIEGQTYPEDLEPFTVAKKDLSTKQPTEKSAEPRLSKLLPKYFVHANEQFIETDRARKETPDGAFVSKTSEPATPSSPTYKKKGASRSDTFEERCRQILGMDTYGDTPGTYSRPTTVADVEKKKTIDSKETEPITSHKDLLYVKIEDCHEDDESFSIDSVKQTLQKRTNTAKKTDSTTLKEEQQEREKKTTRPESNSPKEIFETELVYAANKTKYIQGDKNVSLSQVDLSESDIVEEKGTYKSQVNITKTPAFTPSARSTSPSKHTTSPRSLSPIKGASSPKRDAEKRKPNKDSTESKPYKKSTQKLDDTTTIKDRLRSSTRKTVSPSKRDQIDGSESSPERSPTRYTERRRSSNISVTTEIIIEHTDSDTPNKKENSPPTIKKPQGSVFKEIIDSTVLPEKLIRRMPVTERKESAPVHRVTSRDKDSKMSRSTSENLIKVKKPEPHSLSPASPTKTSDHRRPNKCFSTKSINLSAADRLINIENMENVIIDIQHAKSSREPSPDKIVPTPVPAHLDTGKPRYPDVVQEPEDEQSKRRPQVNNIPIFEEENNSYVGCHITEVNVERSHKTTYDSLDYEEHILKNPVVEAPLSLDDTSANQSYEDEHILLTTDDNSSKFQNLNTDIKTTSPLEADNERLVIRSKKTETVNDDDEYATKEHIYTTVKLAPTMPQKSPELVRTISRHISRQNEPDSKNIATNAGYTLTSHYEDRNGWANNTKTAKEFKVSHQTTTEITSNTAEKYQQPEDGDDHEDDELIPHTATHTTILEERRQKDILSRPSVFDNRNNNPTSSPIKGTATGTATTTVVITKTPLQYDKSPVKDSEKLRPDIKSHTKPTSTVTNTLVNDTTAIAIAAATARTTTAITATSSQPKQSPQRKNSDNDYELRGSNVETGVKNSISKQTKAYNNNISSDSKTNDLKKSTASNKKPEKHMPVRLTPARNSDEHDLSADDEMIITVEEITDIDTEPQVVNDDFKKETNGQVPSTTPTTAPLKKESIAHSSTDSSPTDQPLKTKIKAHVVKLTDKNSLKSNTVTSTTSIKTYETVERPDDIDETLLEPTAKKPSSHPHTKSIKMSTTSTDSVAARRSLFESNNTTSSATHIKRTPLSSPISGRRPSYMDPTKSSLEHTRRDSLEINKSNYSRKPSRPEEEVAPNDRSSIVKFDVPQSKRTASVNEDINVEEIFELEVLEKLLETVQSYEIRRRIRAQIRLIKKNQKNELISSCSEVATRTVQTSKVASEEPDTVAMSSKATITAEEDSSHVSSSKKEYIFEETYRPTTRRSPKPNRLPLEPEKKPDRHHIRPESPQSDRHQDKMMSREQSLHKNKQQYDYKNEYEREEVHEVRHGTSPTRTFQSPTRRPHSVSISPERSNASPESYNSLKADRRSRSPQTKSLQSSRITSSRSPDTKTSSTTVRKSSTICEQQEAVKSSITKPQTKGTSTTTTTPKSEDKTPLWADRKNILKASSNTSKKQSSSTLDSRAGYTKTVKSTTTQKISSKKSSLLDDDCVTSSYGIGPTDENGLPLFGIKALKKKKPTVEPSETTEELTGYVIEEKCYSDNRTMPRLERKEFIYSTNPEELKKLKEQAEESTAIRKGLQDVELRESRQAALISKATPALRSSPEDDFLDSTTKYVRRGSVKEMSEKFIHKEASLNVTEKSNNYPKAGLILRTNSRKSSRDVDNESETCESYKATRVQQYHTSTVLADSDNAENEYEIEEVASRHSGRFLTESESECDSIKTQREFKQITSSSSSSSMATRSFLNSRGEEKVVSNVSDCLERMRNADNVVEEGDTSEDQEARSLLNKFLGASVIMKGVESSVPATNRQSKIITTTTTSSNFKEDNEADNNGKNEVKTTRTTKTIKSGSSSTPVTCTTCDIEEIWDEEILKELLEQARTYEERRKIRSRLRELMADREETKKSPKGQENKTTTAVTPAAVGANDPEEEEESASEYEEIIEEVTDYSEAESDEKGSNHNDKADISAKPQANDKTSDIVVTRTTEKFVTATTKSPSKQDSQTEQFEETKTVTKTETVDEVVEEISTSEGEDNTDSSDKGESLMVHNKPQRTLQIMPQEIAAQRNQSANSQKLKSAQTSSNIKSKATAVESSSMHASCNNSSKIQKQISTASTTSQNPTVTVQTASRTDFTPTSNANYRNCNNGSRQTNSNTNVRYANNDSSSGSLGGNPVVVGNNAGLRQVDRLGVPQKEDSGTESGEDLRLIAAGLRDQLQIQSDSNIIEDVTCALSRLESSLKEGKAISVDAEKQKALLALVARLRAGLTSPEKLAEIAAAMSELDGNECAYGETSSPEADAHRSNRCRFGKRKNRVSRHTVGVSREELADARRYMEDMLLISNMSQSTTPDANSMVNNTPAQWYPLEKNASTGSILTQNLTPQFIPEEKPNTTYTNRLLANNGKRRPHSGEFSVSFQNPTAPEGTKEFLQGDKQSSPSEESSKISRFTNKKQLMKRANTIDLAKTRRYNPEFDTDSDAEDKGANLGLKRAVQVNVKKRVQNVVPPFEPKTENDRKFLAFINKQSDKPGLSWTTSRSVSNWTNKFGSIKSTFEGGIVGKPPQPPHHVSNNTKPQQYSKLHTQPVTKNGAHLQAVNNITNHQIAVRLQREAERQTEERRRKLERERLEYDRSEREKFERQRQQRERLERERLECEHFERQRREQDKRTVAHHAAILRKQEQLAATQQSNANMSVPKPIPVNEFKHAPQSVFRPINNGDTPTKTIYKPIPQLPRNTSTWQRNTLTATSPVHHGNTRPDNSFITSPPPSTRSPIALPWASKPTVDNSSFKSKAHRFEERSKYENTNGKPIIQRHNSLRSPNECHIIDDFRKRPSLPNAFDPYSVTEIPPQQDPLAHLPPPQNISFTYSSLKPNITYQSYPCLPSAVIGASSENNYHILRQDSLTDPHSVPLVLTSAHPSYCPPTQTIPQPQKLQPNQRYFNRQFDLISPATSAPTSPSIYNMQQADFTDDDLDSENNLLEYRAVSRVMGKPQSQTAVTVGRRTGHISDDEVFGKNSRAAKNLLNTMRSLGNSNGMTRARAKIVKSPETPPSRKTCLSPDGRSYQAPVVDSLFPELNKFEANRNPTYFESKKQTSNPTYTQPETPNPLGVYKSMENLNAYTPKKPISSTQQHHVRPYISETKSPYVVTYPVEDTTDDEGFIPCKAKKITPPKSLDLRSNGSEHLPGSSTSAATSFTQNLPSPNTNWTSNPILADETTTFQNKAMATQNSNKSIPPSPGEPTYQTHSSQVRSYSNARRCEDLAQRQIPSLSTQQQNASPSPIYNNVSAKQLPTKQIPPSATSTPKAIYEDPVQRPFQQQHFLSQNAKANLKSTPTIGQATERSQKPAISKKPTDLLTEGSAKPTNSTSAIQDNKSSTSVKKTVEYKSFRGADQKVINPTHSNLSQEMSMRLDQQRERISNEIRRKSSDNSTNYQTEKTERHETQSSQVYKSSAPPDTPDIVKSSLPKDETQPILKKFGPPQRHHYMPNSYQSPNANSNSASAAVAPKHTIQLQGQSVSRKTVVTTSQQILSSNRPTVMETPATPQPDDDYIPRNIVYNNIHAFSSMSRRQEGEPSPTTLEQHHTIRPSKLSKSDSWTQIMVLQNQQVPTNTIKFNQSPTNDLRRTKSGHTLALPKMFEAAITKTDISEKQKTVAAYFTGQKSPTQQETVAEQLQQTTKRSVINRTKTSQKISAASRKSLGSSLPIVPAGLQRSATMPHIANLNLLDETNVEDAFEQLIMEQKQLKSSSSTTEKTETEEKDGAVVTTTTKVTTRTVTGTATKPASPFAKFKQLDKQSAKSPTIATTTAGGSTASPSSGNQPIFKFTDPALTAKAATVKEQLLQWCQSKTQEYENIEITNFSTSWNNGLAFCALIHHFLPDAFEYSQLTPKNRRKNFELAFTVADEKAGIAPLLDVEDMVVMQRPDWKCVFVYVQSIYRRFRNCQ